MKNLLATIVVLALSGSAIANVTYTETVGIYVVRTGSAYWSWYHNNPAETTGGGPLTPDEYQQAALAGGVDTSLTIVMDDLNQNDNVSVWIMDRDNVWHDLGLLETMTIPDDGLGPSRGPDAYEGHQTSTTFDIDPIWLNGLPVEMRLVPNYPTSGPFEIETSTLSVTVTPAPGAILLGGIGVVLVGWMRRRRTL